MQHSRPLLICIALAVVGTGCPHAFGKGGTIDQAVLKDMYERARRNKCTLSVEDWSRLCADPDDDEAESCPEGCASEDWHR